MQGIQKDGTVRSAPPYEVVLCIGGTIRHESTVYGSVCISKDITVRYNTVYILNIIKTGCNNNTYLVFSLTFNSRVTKFKGF